MESKLTRNLLVLPLLFSFVTAQAQWTEQSGEVITYARNNTGLSIFPEANDTGTHVLSGQSLNLIFNSNNIGTDKFSIRADGSTLSTSTEIFTIIGSTKNVGIGTASPTEKLDVNGTIRSEEVKVELTGWPDYVFKEDYLLLSLDETENYIKQNHHLPDIPSAKEIKEGGISLGRDECQAPGENRRAYTPSD